MKDPEIPTFVPPMIVTDASKVPSADQFVFEPEIGGYRGELAATGSGVWITHHTGTVATEKYPRLVAEAPIALNGVRALVDGEIFAKNRQGNVDYNELRKGRPNAFFMAFDILNFNGVALLDQPFWFRRRLLHRVFQPTAATPHLTLAPQFDYVNQAVEWAINYEAEGVIAKRIESKYTPGRPYRPRTNNWQRIPVNPPKR